MFKNLIFDWPASGNNSMMVDDISVARIFSTLSTYTLQMKIGNSYIIIYQEVLHQKCDFLDSMKRRLDYYKLICLPLFSTNLSSCIASIFD